VSMRGLDGVAEPLLVGREGIGERLARRLAGR
jgi:hypothetical protein